MNVRKFALACVVAAIIPATGTAGTVSYFAITGDGDSGISNSKTYIHALDLGPTSNATPTINGVLFTKADLAYIAANPSIVSLTNSGGGTLMSNNVGNNLHGLAGGIGTLVTDMAWNDNAPANAATTLSLKGLTIGQNYSTRIYSRRWDGSVNRVATLDFDTNNNFATVENTTTIDQNHPEFAPTSFGTNTTYAVVYNFQADATQLNIRFTQAGTASWHIYGVTTEVAPVPEPASFALAVLGLFGLLAGRRLSPKK